MERRVIILRYEKNKTLEAVSKELKIGRKKGTIIQNDALMLLYLSLKGKEQELQNLSEFEQEVTDHAFFIGKYYSEEQQHEQ